MSVAALASRVESAQGGHQRASDLLAELRSRFEPEEVPPPPENEGGMSASDIGHTILDIAGFIPVVGVAADLIHAGWYAAEGDYSNAALTAAAAIPGIGDAAKLGSMAADVTRAVGISGAGIVTWRNGHRTLDGKFGSPLDGRKPGQAAADAVRADIDSKPGWRVIGTEVSVRNDSGQLRRYDICAQSPGGSNVGVEVKSGNARLTPQQREFDQELNSSPNNVARGVGQNRGLEVHRAVTIRR